MYICKQCQKQFERKMALIGHTRIHNGKPYPKRKKDIFVLGDSNLLQHQCRYCSKNFSNGLKLGGHVVRCKQNPNLSNTLLKLSTVMKSKKLSEEHKRKIGLSVKKYLTKNPEQVPYLLNHSSKGPSYPERYFKDVFLKENIDLKFWVHIKSYTLDFCDPIKKVDVEIDGEQHYVDSKIIQHDEERNRVLINLGFKIYRVRWATYQRLSPEQKRNEIQKLKIFLLEA